MKPTWRVIAASVPGTSHQQKGLPCQDAHGYRILPNGVLLLAIADGAGSASRSMEGAHTAVSQALTALEQAVGRGSSTVEVDWQVILIDAFRQALASLSFLASPGIDLREFATTLTCTVVTPMGLAVGQLGDGVVVARNAEGRLFATNPPQRGEYVNETFFLTMPEALQRVDVRVYPGPVQALALTTDGLLRLAMNLTADEPHLPFFQPLLAFAVQVEDEAEAQAQLTAFLASERVCARTDDDKTLVLAVPIKPQQ